MNWYRYHDKWNNLFSVGSVGSYKIVDEYNQIFIIYLYRLAGVALSGFSKSIHKVTTHISIDLTC